MRTAFYISDGTGITSEVFGHALLSLFQAEFDHVTIPFVETTEKALQTKQRINNRYKTTGVRPLVFLTFVDEGLRAIINSSEGVCYDFLNAFVEPMQKEFGIQAMPKTHRTHSIHEKTYDFRIDAVNYALANDDGSNLKEYAKADIILVGVSRSGKTPTSLYLALQYGIKAANYPFVQEDMDMLRLPDVAEEAKSQTVWPDHYARTFAVKFVSSAAQTVNMRHCGNANWNWMKWKICIKRERIPFLNSTTLSIEEISAKIMAETGLKRQKY